MKQSLVATIVDNLNDAPGVPGAIEFIGRPRDPQQITGMAYHCPACTAENFLSFSKCHSDERPSWNGRTQLPTISGRQIECSKCHETYHILHGAWSRWRWAEGTRGDAQLIDD